MRVWGAAARSFRFPVVLLIALVGSSLAVGPSTTSAQDSTLEALPPSDGPIEQPAHRDSDELARAAFLLGQRAFEDGDFDTALSHFQQSYSLSQRPALLFNIGASLDRLRRNQEALDHFRRYLEEDEQAPNRREVEGRVRIIEAALAAEAREQEQEEQRLREAREASNESGGVLSEWWFWAIVGVVLVGGGVATYLLLNEESEQDPIEGTVPGVTFTLGAFK